MNHVLIEKGDLFSRVDELILKDAELVAPQKHGNFTAFAKLKSADDIIWGAPQSVIPPKQFLYPQSEELIEYEFGNNNLKITPKNKIKELILFGVHPCDLNAICLMDRVFAEKNLDENYLEKRKAATIIGVDCKSPCSPEAICLRMDGLDPKGRFDLFLTETSNYFFAQAATKKGEAIIAGLGKKAKAEDLKKLKAMQKKRDSLFNRKEKKLLPKYKDLPKLMSKTYEHPEWEERGRKDTSCGSCNMVCPTCYCFDVQDYMHVSLQKGVRSRFWDGCMLEDFAKVATGENFRENRFERLRHRTYRKLYYLFEKYGESFCTGCGRCVKACLPKIVSPLEIANAIYKRQ